MDTPPRDDMSPGDEAPEESPVAGEDICPRCTGRGEVDGEPCVYCGGTGRIQEAIGGG